MSAPEPPAFPGDQQRAERIRQIVDECLERLAQGQQVCDHLLAQSHPDLMPELAEALRRLRVVEAARHEADGFGSGGAAVAPTWDAAGGELRPVVEEPSALSAIGAERIAHFDLLEALGAGNFGVVWKARDTRLDRIVALKVPRKGQLNPDEAEQFLREARAAAQLNHPNIVSVHEVGRDGDVPYIVSDLVQGVTLSQWLAAHRCSPREAAALCVKIAEALHHAHESGVIHRDLKPGNIMLDTAGEPRLMDFGLAKREVGEATLTVEGRVLGTPAYMSPEQARGEAHRVDRRSDVYSLGVVLFQFLTGELPFRGSVQMLIVQILQDEPPRPRRLNSSVPRDLETIALKCLEKEPHARYATAREVADELRRFLAGEPIHARPVGAVGRAWRWCKRKPMIAGLGGSLAALLVAIATAGPPVALYQRSLRRQAEHAQQSLEITLADTYTSFGLAAGQRGDRAQAVLWFAHAAGLAPFDRQRAEANRVRVRAWSRETPVPVRALVHEDQQLRELLPHPAGRYLLVLAFDEKCTLWDLESEQPVALPECSPCVSAAAWSRDGKYLAAGTSEGEVRLLEFPSGRCAERILHPGPISALAFSPDGQFLALASDRARVWSCAERRWATGEMLHPRAATVTHLGFSSGDDRLAIAWGNDEASVFSLAGQPEQLEPLLEPVPHLHQVPPALLANGRVLITVDGSGGLVLWDVDTGKKISAVPSTVGGANDIRALQVSPNSRYVVVCGYPNAQVYRVDDPHNPVALTPARTIQHLNRVVAADFSPDSRMVLTASIDRTARLSRSDLGSSTRGSPEAEGDEGPLPERIVLHQDEVILAVYAPDGRSFVTAQADGLVRVWAVCLAEGRRVPLPAAESYVALTPDGQSVVPSGWRSQRGLGTVQMYQLATGKAVGPALRPGGLVNAAFVSPDGRQMTILSSLEENVHRRAWPELQLDRHPGWVSFWDLTSAQSRAAPRRTPSEPMGGAYSSDGRLAAVVCAKGEVLWIDPADGRVTMQAVHPGAARPGALPCRWLQFAPDGKCFATWGLGSVVCLWDKAAGTLRHALTKHGKLCRSANFAPDGRMLVTASEDRKAILWDLATGRDVATLRHPDWVFDARFSPDGRQVLTGCRDHMARLWDYATGELVCSPFEHDDEVYAVNFSRDGRWVLTCGRDGTTRAWDWRTGKLLTPPWPLGGRGYQLEVTPDGRYAVVAGAMGGIEVFDLDDLLAPAAAELDCEALRLVGEILSGRRVYEGGGTINLTTKQWLEAWRTFRRSYPDHLRGNATGHMF